MSELNLGPAQQTSPVKAILIAVMALVAVAVGVFYLNPRKTADARVTDVKTYSYKGTSQEVKGSGNVVGQAATVESDLYVVATVHIDNKLRLPLFLNGMEATYVAADGTEKTSHAASSDDIARMEEIFPALKPLLSHPLNFADAIAPQSPSEGQVLLEFPGFSEQTWQQRKSASITINFTHQAPLTVAVP